MLANFKPYPENKEILSSSVLNIIESWSNEDEKKEFLIAKIDPLYAESFTFCEKYEANPLDGANCLIVEIKRGTSEYAALMVPVGFRYNMSSLVRKHFNAKAVSVAPLDYVIEKTNMELDSITPIGLPGDWPILIDPLVFEKDNIIVGGGNRQAKLIIPSKFLLKLPNAIVMEGLRKEV